MKNWPRIGFWILLLGLSAGNLVYLRFSPLDLCGDEAHYWEWARHMDICYYSKGPVVAYLIWLATHIGGDSPFAIRTVAVLLAAGSMAITYALGRRLFKSEAAGFLGTLLLVSAPMINIGAGVLTIDSPLCFFWLAAVGAWCLALFGRNGADAVPRGSGWWYVGGLCASIGFLAKFTALFLLPGLLLFLLISKEDRRWLRTPQPYLALLLGLLGFLPFIVWNYEHGWVTVHHLMALGGAGRSKLFDPEATPMFFAQTAAVLSPIIFCFLVYGIAKSTKLALKAGDRAHLFCQVFVWPVLIFYAFVVLHKSVPVNWPFTSYLTGMVAAGAIIAERLAAQREAGRRGLQRWIVAGVCLGFVISVVLRFAFVFYPLMHAFGIPASTDHAAKMFLGYREIGARVSEVVREMAAKDGHEPFIFSDNYRLASELGFYTDRHYPNYCINVGQRHNQYDFWPGFEDKLGRNGICVREDLLQKGRASEEDLGMDDLRKAFARVDAPEPLLIRRLGVPVKRFDIYRCYGFKGWKPPEKKRKY